MTHGRLNQDFVDGLQSFLDFASSQQQCMDGNKISCPCNGRKCQNHVYHDLDTIQFHVAKYGFFFRIIIFGNVMGKPGWKLPTIKLPLI